MNQRPWPQLSNIFNGDDWSTPALPVRPGQVDTPVQTPEPVPEPPKFAIVDERESKQVEDNGDNEKWLADFDTKTGDQYRGSNCGNRKEAMNIHAEWMAQKPNTYLKLTFPDTGETREIPYTSILWLRVYKKEDVF